MVFNAFPYPIETIFVYFHTCMKVYELIFKELLRLLEDKRLNSFEILVYTNYDY